jgi:hypothetical protein
MAKPSIPSKLAFPAKWEKKGFYPFFSHLAGDYKEGRYLCQEKQL